jgi:Na+/proline symporter
MFVLQYLGTAIFLPFYFYLDLDHHFSGAISDPSVDYLQARSLLPAGALAFLNCFRMAFFPPSSITQSTHQAHIAFYQIGPFACYALVAALSSLGSVKGPQTPGQAKNADAWWIKTTYAVFGVFSGVVHVAILAYVMTSKDTSLSLSRLFVPEINRTSRPNAAEIRYVEEHLFFLQWDFILVVLACALYATRTLEGMYCKRSEGWTSVQGGILVFLIGVACTFLSPGAVISLILYLREDILRTKYDHEQNVPAKRKNGASAAS